MKRRGIARRMTIGAVALAAALAVVPLAAPSASAAAKPTGKPIILFTIDNEQFAATAGAIKAASDAINKAGGVKDPAGGPNRPFKVVWCKETDANSAAACGRQAASSGALAVVGNQSAFGAEWAPPIFDAGIPFVAGPAYDAITLTNKLSFPITNSVDTNTGGYQFLGNALGLKTSWQITPDLPQAQAFAPIVKQADDLAGIKNLGVSAVSASTTQTPDYTPYAAAAAGSDAQFIWMNIGPGGVGVMQALLKQGVDFHKTAVMAATNAISATDLAPLGKFKNGVYLVGPAYPETWTANKGVRQFNSELNASKITKKGRGDNAMIAWTGTHVIANLIPKMKEITPAALVDAMNSAGPIQYGPVAPFDWSKPAYTEGLLATLRFFSNQTLAMRVVNDEVVPVSKGGFFNITEPFKVTAAGQLKNGG